MYGSRAVKTRIALANWNHRYSTLQGLETTHFLTSVRTSVHTFLTKTPHKSYKRLYNIFTTIEMAEDCEQSEVDESREENIAVCLGLVDIAFVRTYCVKLIPQS